MGTEYLYTAGMNVYNMIAARIVWDPEFLDAIMKANTRKKAFRDTLEAYNGLNEDDYEAILAKLESDFTEFMKSSDIEDSSKNHLAGMIRPATI